MTVPGRKGAEILVAGSPVDFDAAPQVAARGPGGFVAGWSEAVSGDADGGATAVVRLFGAGGRALGPATPVLSDLGGSSRLIDLVGLEGGGFAATVESFSVAGQEARSVRHMLAVFDADGDRVAELPIRNAFLRDGQSKLAALSDGRVGVHVERELESGDLIAELWVLGADGAFELERGLSLRTDAGRLVNGGAEVVGAGDALAAISVRQGALVGLDLTTDAALRLVGADGTLRRETLFADDRPGFARFELVRLSDGRFAVFEWTSLPGTLDYVPRLHLFGEKGGLIRSRELPVVEDGFDASRPRLLEDVAETADGGLLAVFRSVDDLSSSRADLLGWKFDAAGRPEGDLFRINAETAGFQSEADVTARGDGEVVAIWEDRRDGSSAEMDHYAQALSLGGRDWVGGRRAERETGGRRDDALNGRGGDDTLSGRDGEDTLTGGGGRDRLAGQAGEDRLLGGPGGDRLFGGAGGDRLLGGGANDRLVGGGGGDVLVGARGGDVLIGGGGADLLRGGGGRDRLDGRAGADRLIGGPGEDVFVLRAGADVARDFTPGEDRLLVARGADGFRALEFEMRGGDLVVIAGGAEMRLEEVTRSEFGRADVDFV